MELTKEEFIKMMYQYHFKLSNPDVCLEEDYPSFEDIVELMYKHFHETNQ